MFSVSYPSLQDSSGLLLRLFLTAGPVLALTRFSSPAINRNHQRSSSSSLFSPFGRSSWPSSPPGARVSLMSSGESLLGLRSPPPLRSIRDFHVEAFWVFEPSLFSASSWSGIFNSTSTSPLPLDLILESQYPPPPSRSLSTPAQNL